MLVELKPQDVKDQINSGEAVLVDVREPSEYEDERVPGAFLMPLSLFNSEQFIIPTATRVILMCKIGGRSAQAAEQLMNTGIETVYHMGGGIEAWKASGFEVQVY